jgi:FkbM family methyltransferase
MMATADARTDRGPARAWRFARKPWSEKRRSLYYRWVRNFPSVPLPLKLPFGGWWLVRNDYCSLAILAGTFEKEESRFVEGFLRAGMTVLDIGAHHGYYTLLASKKAGPEGRVIAFEPSPRERRFLSRHVQLSGCANVTVEACALGSERGEADLFVVEGTETGCNSLRPPKVSQATRTCRVAVEALDDYLETEGVRKVDLVKLDAEGGELEILRGANRLLERVPRPVILAEVQDVRTQSWGYAARDIISFLDSHGFSWHRFAGNGALEALPLGQEAYDGNFVAVPEERRQELAGKDQRD